MKSKRYVKSISISDESHERFLFEGNLGELVESSLMEGYVLEIIGLYGVMRLDLTLKQLRKIIKKVELVRSERRGGAHNKYQER